MPGIDRKRIVGKEEDELDELTCSICHDIFDEPVVTHCCRQTYCMICINQWLQDNSTCPNDRQHLDSNGLIPAPRIIYNFLNKLNVKCENYSKCQMILSMEEMKNHMKTCFNCDSCKALKSSVDEKERENQILRKMLQKKDNDVKLVIEKKEGEMQLLKQELNQLKEVNQRFRQLGIEHTNRNQKDVIEAVRRDSKYTITTQYGLTEPNKTFLVEIATNSIQSKNNFFEISKDIYKRVKAKDDLKHFNWMVLVDFYAENNDPFIIYNKALYLCFNGLQIRILGFQEINGQKGEIELVRENINQYQVIEKCDFTEEQIIHFVGECKIAINRYDEYDKITKHLADKLKNLTRAKWTVLAFTTTVLGYCTSSYKKVFVDFGRIKIRAYKTHLTM